MMKIDTEKTDVTQEVKDMAAICKAMAHPVRVHILHKLSVMNACCYSGDLVDELPVGRSTLSQHLKELKYAGLIQGEIEPPYIKYCINRENWNKARALFHELFDEAKPIGGKTC
jgi:DNA-binding transcriptional ArsR family regulator